jgi:hypothetical protein
MLTDDSAEENKTPVPSLSLRSAVLNKEKTIVRRVYQESATEKSCFRHGGLASQKEIE